MSDEREHIFLHPAIEAWMRAEPVTTDITSHDWAIEVKRLCREVKRLKGLLDQRPDYPCGGGGQLRDGQPCDDIDVVPPEWQTYAAWDETVREALGDE